MSLNDKLTDPEMDPDPVDPSTPADTPVPPTPEAPAAKPGRRRHGCAWAVFFAVVLIGLGAAFWIRYCNPYVTDAQVRGYIGRVERRGIIFKTFEGEMLVKAAIDDSARVYSRDFTFSIDNDSLAHVIQSYTGSGKPVVVTYRSYYGTLPWRGSSLNVAEAIEPADR